MMSRAGIVLLLVNIGESVALTPIPDSCKDGDLKKVDCNKCVCRDGTWSCTEMYCPPPQGCVDGSEDQTNPCMPRTCFNGEWMTAVIDCLDPSSVTCPDGEQYQQVKGSCCPQCVPGASNPTTKTCKDGELKKLDCNKCVCRDGAWTCTEMSCPPPVEKEYVPCAGKPDGAVCQHCSPKDPTCMETMEVKTCQKGQCKSDVVYDEPVKPVEPVEPVNSCNPNPCKDKELPYCRTTTVQCLVASCPEVVTCEPYTCFTRLSSGSGRRLMEVWSTGKVEWCCKHYQLGCPDAKPSLPPSAASDVVKPMFPTGGETTGGSVTDSSSSSLTGGGLINPKEWSPCEGKVDGQACSVCDPAAEACSEPRAVHRCYQAACTKDEASVLRFYIFRAWVQRFMEAFFPSAFKV